MLNEIFSNTFWFCGTIVVAVLTVVTVKLAWGYLFGSRAPMDEFSREWAASLRASDLEPRPAGRTLPDKSALRHSVNDRVPVDFMGKAPEVELEEVDTEEIFCGVCREQIMSPCVEIQQGTVPSDAKRIFQCEHCHERVAVPLPPEN